MIIFFRLALSVLYFLLILTAKSQPQKIYLNPKAPGSGKQSQFLDSIRFIPLEVVQGIELGTLNNMEVTEKLLLIKDYPRKTILVYTKGGNFIKKINWKKLGNVYPVYIENTNQLVFFGNNENYTLTQKDQVKIKLNWDNPRNRKYFKKYVIDLNDPSLTTKKSIPDQNDISRAYYFYDDYYIQGQITTSPLYKDSTDYEVKIFKSNQLVKRFFPYNCINEPRFLYSQESTSFNRTNVPYIHFITRPYCDTVYKLVKDSLFPAYQIVLPLENSLPPSFFTRPFKNKTELDNFKRNNGWMLRQVYNFYETPELIYFLIGYFGNYETYIYQKETKTTYKAKNIRPDDSQYNLQLLADFNILKKGDWFYKPQKAGDLLNFFEKNKNIPIPNELEEFLKSKPHATAPVIVEFKLKS
jgi:hypothetical protein